MRAFLTCALLTVALLTVNATSAQAGWYHHGPIVVIRPAPVLVIRPAPVIVTSPAPLVYAQPTIVGPAYAPAPVLVTPVNRPIVSLRFGFR